MPAKSNHLADLLRLPPVERLEVVDVLLNSLDDDGEEPGWEAAWSDELKQRLEGLQNGTREPSDAEKVFADAYRKLDTRHD